jgi:hypothetical protein
MRYRGSKRLLLPVGAMAKRNDLKALRNMIG